jgi:hypothetical protein
MDQPLGTKEFAKRELKRILSFNATNRPWSVPLLASLCVGLPLVVGLLIGRFHAALTVSTAGLVILYMPTNSNFVARMSKMLICSFGFMISYGIGVIFSFNFIVLCIAFGIFSAIVHWISLFFKLNPPGNFFFIMIASTAGNLPFSIDQISDRIGLIAIGTILACFLALVYSITKKTPGLAKETTDILHVVRIKRYADYVEAVIVGFFMFCSILAGHLLELNNPYWVPISCIAVMQGATAYHIWRRGFYRILGTVLGMGLCWIILSSIKQPLLICLAIAALQFIIEATVTRNYALAVFFITPLTILLFEAANPVAQNPTELITARLIDVMIGSFIGAVGGWFMHHEKLRYKAVRRIRIVKVAIQKRR